MDIDKNNEIKLYKVPSMGAAWPSFVATITNLAVSIMIKDQIDEDSALKKAITLYNEMYKRIPEYIEKQDTDI